jgi:CO/xanthine dehydrogenase FAD-binding subunit
LRDFEYFAPSTLDEAIGLLQQHGSQARVLAGGTDLVLMLTDRVIAPEYMIDIKNVQEVNVFDWGNDGGLTIGAAVPFRTMETSAECRRRYPGLVEAASEVGSWQIRNLATIGGNLCTASPSAEIAPILVALNAQAEIAGPKGRRQVAMEQFATGVRRTVLEPDELLVHIVLPPAAERTSSHYIKFKEREKMDIAFVSVAAAVGLDGGDGVIKDARIVLGAVATTPIRAPKAEAALRGQRLSDAVLDAAGREAAEACRPISDVRASAEYRREMVNVLTRRAVRQAAALAAQR